MIYIHNNEEEAANRKYIFHPTKHGFKSDIATTGTTICTDEIDEEKKNRHILLVNTCNARRNPRSLSKKKNKDDEMTSMVVSVGKATKTYQK